MGACSLIDLIDLGDYLFESEETLLQSKQTSAPPVCDLSVKVQCRNIDELNELLLIIFNAQGQSIGSQHCSWRKYSVIDTCLFERAEGIENPKINSLSGGYNWINSSYLIGGQWKQNTRADLFTTRNTYHLYLTNRSQPMIEKIFASIVLFSQSHQWSIKYGEEIWK